MDKLASQIILEVLTSEMNLAANSIWIRNQNVKIPNDNGLYLIVGMTDAIPFSSKTYLKEDGADTLEVNEVQMKENIQVDIISRSNDAVLRRWEVMAAMKSIAAQQAQEENSFRIFQIPSSFVNSSNAEGGSTLNRFSISIPCMVWYRKETTLTADGKKYYDTFETRVDDESTIADPNGLFEFTITAEE